MKINRLESKISFGESSFVIQNVKPEDIKYVDTDDLVLKQQPKQDEFIKEDKKEITPQERKKNEDKIKQEEFQKLIHKPQKFSIEA